jgi:hypothetical protein
MLFLCRSEIEIFLFIRHWNLLCFPTFIFISLQMYSVCEHVFVLDRAWQQNKQESFCTNIVFEFCFSKIFFWKKIKSKKENFKTGASWKLFSLLFPQNSAHSLLFFYAREWRKKCSVVFKKLNNSFLTTAFMKQRELISSFFVLHILSPIVPA